MSTLHDQPRVLILVSGSVNYYYDVIGYRIAQALHNLGISAVVHPLKNAVEQEYEWLFIVNLHEVVVGYGDEALGIQRIRQLRSRAKKTYVVLLECVLTQWFRNNMELINAAGIDGLLDLGFHTQYQDAPASAKALYKPLFNGLTTQERQQVQRLLSKPSARTIPWAFIGNQQTRRVQLVEMLVQQLAVDGLVYLPAVSPVAENGPHITESQMQTILEHTQWYIWNAHHHYFYVESERFRNALMAGAVPIKICDGQPQPTVEVPFSFLMLYEADLIEWLSTVKFEDIRQQFADEYLKRPSLEAEISSIVGEAAQLRTTA